MANPLEIEKQGDAHERSVLEIVPASRNPLRALASSLELFEYQDLFVTLCRHRASVRYKQSVLGVAWALLQPISLMLIYLVIFSVVTQMPSEDVPYAAFVFAGLLPWIYFSSAVSTATMSLVSHNQMVTKVYFPREILPISYVVVGLLDFFIASTLLAVMIVYYHIAIGWVIWGVIPLLIAQTILVIALSLLCSAIQVRFRDLGLAMPLLMQLWMFASPVVYPLSKVPARLKSFYVLNPMVGILENFRRVVLHRLPLDMPLFWTAVAISTVLLVVSYSYFKIQETTMADVI